MVTNPQGHGGTRLPFLKKSAIINHIHSSPLILFMCVKYLHMSLVCAYANTLTETHSVPSQWPLDVAYLLVCLGAQHWWPGARGPWRSARDKSPGPEGKEKVTPGRESLSVTRLLFFLPASKPQRPFFFL